MNPRHILHALVLVAAALLTGCASGVREVRSTVRSYSTLSAVPAPAVYRLELLPSQRAAPAQFAAIEMLAQQALAQVGLQRDDAAASLVVHIGIDARERRDHWGDWPRGGAWLGHHWWGWPYGRGGWAWHGGFYDRGAPQRYRAVSIVMRDAATQAIVYETSAMREDVWSDDPAIFGALFKAALTGFPQPPQGARQVRMPL